MSITVCRLSEIAPLTAKKVLVADGAIALVRTVDGV